MLDVCWYTSDFLLQKFYTTSDSFIILAHWSQQIKYWVLLKLQNYMYSYITSGYPNEWANQSPTV